MIEKMINHKLLLCSIFIIFLLFYVSLQNNKHYNNQAGFNNTQLTYYICPSVNKHYKNIYLQAIHVWSKSKYISFKRITNSSKAEIVLDVKKYDTHHDLDYTGTTYLPNIGSPSHFNYVEIYSGIFKKWNYTDYEQLTTAEHEIGHAMGLTHVHSNKSVMNPHNLKISVSKYDFNTIKAVYKGKTKNQAHNYSHFRLTNLNENVIINKRR